MEPGSAGDPGSGGPADAPTEGRVATSGTIRSGPDPNHAGPIPAASGPLGEPPPAAPERAPGPRRTAVAPKGLLGEHRDVVVLGAGFPEAWFAPGCPAGGWRGWRTASVRSALRSPSMIRGLPSLPPWPAGR